jgi:cystathionine beta-lyase/cystathionine gamma-synthase
MKIDPEDITICLGHEVRSADGPEPMMPPIIQTSTFAFDSFDALCEGLGEEHRHHVYTRGQNPTVGVLERQLAALERGASCKCFASGMAAISSVMYGLLEAGDHVLFVNQVYGPTLELAEHLRRFGIDYDVVLQLDLDSIELALRPQTKLIWLESPGTMLYRMLDLPAVCRLAKERGTLVGMDNTWSTPLLQKPLTVGVDIVAHSCAKYIGGHSDVVAGALIATDSVMERIFYGSYLLNGGILSPHNAWLLIRGLRTLPTRLQQHEVAGLAVMEFLQRHPKVDAVHHPALIEDRRLVEDQLAGYTGLLSFSLADADHAKVARLIDTLRLFKIGVSWGGVESLVISPNRGPGAEPSLESAGIPPGLIRLSIGLEPTDALIADLDAALSAA